MSEAKNESSGEATTSSELLGALLPCPFCGGNADYVTRGDFYKHKVECSKCGATTGGSAFRNDDYNARMWNART